MSLSRESSHEERKAASDVVYDSLTDYFFNGVNFINYVYSDFGSTTYGGTTGTVVTTSYNKSSRIIDTSVGKHLSVGRISRTKCTFYITQLPSLEGYLLSPASFNGDSLGTPTSLSILRSYVGLKFINNKILIVKKEVGGAEVTYESGVDVTLTNGSTKTHTLEVYHNIRSTDIYIDGVFIRTVESDMVGSDGVTPITFYPLFSPGRSIDGTLVNIVVENFQFIQQKQ